MFNGCCYFSDGTYSNHIALKNIDDAFSYIKMQMVVNKEARIIDESGNVIVQVVDGRIIFP